MEAAWRRAAAYVVCRDDERILLTRFLLPGNPDSGKWTMPGGGMEWGEHPVETADRLEEETGYTADIGRLLGVFSRWFEAHETERGEAGHVIAMVYDATNLRGELRTEFSETTDAAAWFTIDEARAIAHVGVVDFCLDLL